MSKNKSNSQLDPSVKFIHIRYKDSNGNILSSGGVTFAYREEGEGIKYASAKCHPNDNYVKTLGRVKAHGRLSSDKNSHTFAGVEQDFLNALENQATAWNQAERFNLFQAGYDPEMAVQMFRKYNGKRKGQPVAVAEEVTE